MAPGLYDSRARVWSADLGAFLQPDEYGYLSRGGTLWSWPGQNPFRWRDPSGRFTDADVLRFAGHVEDVLPYIAEAALGSDIPPLMAVGEAALISLNVMNSVAADAAQAQSAAAIAKGASNDEKECKPRGPARQATEPNLGELPADVGRSPDENAEAREFYRNNRDEAMRRWEDRNGMEWPRDSNGRAQWAEHPRALKDGGDPLYVEPGVGEDPNAPHMVPGPDGLTDQQRWGALGPPARGQ